MSWTHGAHADDLFAQVEGVKPTKIKEHNHSGPKANHNRLLGI